MPPPAPVSQTDRPAREGSFRLVHRDKVRNTTLAFKTPKLGFTLGLWKDGWIRVQRVAQTCPHFLALAPGDALLRVGDDKVTVPFPRDDFAGLLRKLSAAPRPLELTFVRVLDDAPAPPDVAGGQPDPDYGTSVMPGLVQMHPLAQTHQRAAVHAAAGVERHAELPAVGSPSTFRRLIGSLGDLFV